MNYLLFGIVGENLDTARQAVEAALGIRMVLHDSMYLGGDYFRFDSSDAEEFILQNNFNTFEDEWTEPAHSSYKVLLYASRTTRGAEIRNALEGVGDLLWTKGS
jgi:hypothetical protein